MGGRASGGRELGRRALGASSVFLPTNRWTGIPLHWPHQTIEIIQEKGWGRCESSIIHSNAARVGSPLGCSAWGAVCPTVQLLTQHHLSTNCSFSLIRSPEEEAYSLPQPSGPRGRGFARRKSELWANNWQQVLCVLGFSSSS